MTRLTRLTRHLAPDTLENVQPIFHATKPSVDVGTLSFTSGSAKAKAAGREAAKTRRHLEVQKRITTAGHWSAGTTFEPQPVPVSKCSERGCPFPLKRGGVCAFHWRVFHSLNSDIQSLSRPGFQSQPLRRGNGSTAE